MRDRRFRNRDWNDPKWEERLQEYQQHRQKNKAFFGIAIALIGVLWIGKIVFRFPFDPETQWPYILIVLGLLIGVRHNFRSSAWWILILIGGANLFEMHYPNHREFIWPVILIAVGLAIAFRPRRDSCKPHWKMQNTISTESSVNIDITFGGKKEVITAKDFKGGNVGVTFGGVEINLTQADFSEPTAIMDFRVSFGGVELIVPSHWEIQNEINSSFGNVEDERTIQTPVAGENRKVLILRGSCSFGSIEIKSY